MSKPAVLLVGPLIHTDKEWYALGDKYNLKEFRKGTREEFLSKLKGDFNDVVGLYRSNNSVAQTGRFDDEMCSALPQSLKYIAHNGAGYDNIEVDAFTKRNIQISSTPIAVDNATADIGLFLLLGALRYATVPLKAIRAGEWRGKTPVGHDPAGKVLGILGMGGIGRVSGFRF
jgi:glyoxylate reductase